MAAYIRSKVSNNEFTDVSIEAKDSNAKLRQDGSFKLPVASGVSDDTPTGSLRYNDQIERIEFKTASGWQIIDAITDGLATELYVDDAVNSAISGLSRLAITGDYNDILYRPTTLAGYGITDDVASKEYVDNSISNLVGSAPGFLDTLNEISSALNNDPNFYNNIVTQISSKLSLAGGTLTGALYLPGAPTSDLEAATKKYVDDKTLGLVVNSTDDVPEGSTNQYYTNARATTAARNSISAGTGVVYNNATGVISIGQNVSTNSNVRFNTVTADTIVTNKIEIVSTGDYIVSSATNIILEAGMEVVIDSPLTLSQYTTSEINNLVVRPGTIAFDSSTNKLKLFTATGWIDIGAQFSGNYNDLTNKPTLFSGNYNDLTNKPTIPQTLEDLDVTDGTFGQVLTTDGSGNFYFDDLASSVVDVNIVGEEIVFGADLPGPVTSTTLLHPVATSGNYNDLNNLPTIPSAVSQLANDSNFISSVDWADVQNKPVFNTVATTGDYVHLINTPNIPTDLVQLTDNTGILANVRPGSWNDLTDKPDVIDVATLKSIVAASADFADFQARIANL